ncbi:hypothetical protein A2272_05070 [Candidatus Peregrinibacteria bacterium RIFOXYA12_FULL_33_12]|nr:MAG: hypothetical protein A2272_05070 [Candidatus Peregrinibacteria bacterium RIFOXYA12_FULL_33_12]OGJ49997.1 MAG: hypothetical protein A2307_04485 [Candidatus Peregrinibacteria bacterium RIFOXYB2_FULL_33_20]
MRLDKYITLKYPEKSRNYVQKIIKDSFVFVNKKNQTKPGFEVAENDHIEINFPNPKKLNLKPKKIQLDIIYEDKNLLIINKKAGLSVHPSPTEKSDITLVNVILSHCKNSLSSIGGVMRPGIVHRLDKDTSGIIMIAKNDDTHRYLSDLIAKRKVKKTYLGVVHGKMDTKSGTIDSPIGRHQFDRKKMSIQNDLYGKNAITHFKVLNYLKNLDLSILEIQIITGRTHQIRVHMSAIHHPIIFDKVYGNEKSDNFLNSKFKIQNSKFSYRQLLHAWKLSLKLPNEEQEKTFEAKIPEDMLNFVLKN